MGLEFLRGGCSAGTVNSFRESHFQDSKADVARFQPYLQLALVTKGMDQRRRCDRSMLL